MKLSFILPVYNVEKYLVNCLDSLYRQGLDEQDFEVICVNDGSTDGSLSVLEEYKKNHENFVIMTTPNAGLSAARNTGIRLAQGDYLFYIDSDDYISNDVVRRLLDIAYQNELDMLYFDFIRVHDYEATDVAYFDAKPSEVLPGKEYFAKYVPKNGAWIFLIRRQFVLDNNVFFDEGRFAEDGKHVVLSTSLAKRVMYCHADVYRNVIRENSITTNRNSTHQKKMIDDFGHAIRYINGFVQKERLDNPENRLYIQRLEERRNHFTFYMLVRMMRLNISLKECNEILSGLRKEYCYPNKGLATDCGYKHVTLSKVFQIPFIYRGLFLGYKLLAKASKMH